MVVTHEPAQDRSSSLAASASANHGSTVAPTMVVAEPYRQNAAVLGLDRALPLGGGRRIGPAGLCADLSIDWIPDVAPYLAEACRRQSGAGRDWFRLPPTALVGGRTDDVRHLARRLAEEGEVPLLTLDLTSPETAAAFLPASAGQVALPPAPVTAIAATGCANPIILVTGADRATIETNNAVGSMIDADTSRRWWCPALGAFLDLGGITWLVEVANEHSLHASLYGRLAVLSMREAEGKDAPALRALAFLISLMKDLEFLPSEVAAVICRMTEMDEWKELSRLRTADFERRAVDLLGAAQHRGRF